MRGLGLVATQTLMFLSAFLFAGIEGSAAMSKRLAAPYAGVRADHHWPIRAGLAAHGG